MSNRAKPLILLVEDEGLLSRMYSQKLANDGFDFVVAENGSKGLEVAKQSLPDLILCDVMMPEKDGLSVLKELKGDEQTKNIPVIMLSNLSKQEYVDEAVAAGAVSYLIKSQTLPGDVIKKIKEVLAAAGKQPLVTN
jgi:CheY-like chemotaxis protein